MDKSEGNQGSLTPVERDARQRMLDKLALVRQSQRKSALGRAILARLQHPGSQPHSD
jgi:hypothetical protein